MSRSIYLPLVLVLMAVPCAALHAGAPCCGGCGCQPCTKKVCRLVKEEKEVSKKVYSCKCEDFCVPGRSICCRTPCSCPGKCCKDHVVYKPTCGCVRTRAVPVIEIETKKVPAYKCVVEEVCWQCGHCANKLDYPVTEDPASALAMVNDPNIERVANVERIDEPLPADEPSQPQTKVAGRSFVERLQFWK